MLLVCFNLCPSPSIASLSVSLSLCMIVCGHSLMNMNQVGCDGRQ